ncbi:unnamed protein product [Closterium sp. NIES-64]|nr:unnamed protein product [Closterium sp. NIES-64]
MPYLREHNRNPFMRLPGGEYFSSGASYQAYEHRSVMQVLPFLVRGFESTVPQAQLDAIATYIDWYTYCARASEHMTETLRDLKHKAERLPSRHLHPSLIHPSLPQPPFSFCPPASGLSYNYLTYRVPPLAAGLKDFDVGFNFLSGSFPTNSATSCGANNNCFQAVTGCTTKGTVQRSMGCSFCLSDTAQGMLCYGRDICTVDASAPFAAGTPNAVGATTLPLACVDVLCATASLVMCPTDWRCSGLQCIGNNFANCFGFLWTG